ncbi:MAG: DNA polymerase IV [Alicyclobacillus sp.]|nr:DNA polymerase IV [Alicyclobacillus sp.]
MASERAEPARKILHIDMNAFYCACHAAERPDLYARRPTAVAGSPETRHGVVVTASYEARKRGVRATMTVAEALRVCPELILIHPDFDLYRRYSAEVFKRVGAFTPAVEIFSIDECWADVTGSGQFGDALTIARQLQARILEELRLPCSIGIAPNKLLAKMASDFKKPLGIQEITLADVPDMLWPLPVQQLFGVGTKTAERLQRVGITTIGQLAAANPDRLARMFGKRALEMIAHANGIDDTPLNLNPEPPQSIGHSITLAEDCIDHDTLCTVLMNLSDAVGRRVRKHDMMGKTIQLTIRFANRTTITRAKTLPTPTNLSEDIYATACQLLASNRPSNRPVRLLGVAIGQLAPATAVQAASTPRQLKLFDLMEESEAEQMRPDREKLQRLTAATDQLRNKFGENAVIRGRMLQSHESAQIRDRRARGTSLQKDNLR